MNITICDDDPQMVTRLEGIVASCLAGRPYTCDVFYSAERLLDALREDPFRYQVYLLDVEMAAVTGFQAAASIRQTDRSAAIIFITSHSELMQEAFEVSAFHYLIKPVNEEKARQVILKAVASLEEKKGVFRFQVNKVPHTVYLEQIAYLESLGRKMVLHMANGPEYEYYGTLKDAVDSLPAGLFTQIHNSFVVNLEYISSAAAENVVLQSGAAIPISRKFHKHFNAAYHTYVLTRSV